MCHRVEEKRGTVSLLKKHPASAVWPECFLIWVRDRSRELF
jgi:hypothetical protein